MTDKSWKAIPVNNLIVGGYIVSDRNCPINASIIINNTSSISIQNSHFNGIAVSSNIFYCDHDAASDNANLSKLSFKIFQLIRCLNYHHLSMMLSIYVHIIKTMLWPCLFVSIQYSIISANYGTICLVDSHIRIGHDIYYYMMDYWWMTQPINRFTNCQNIHQIIYQQLTLNWYQIQLRINQDNY